MLWIFSGTDNFKERNSKGGYIWHIFVLTKERECATKLVYDFFFFYWLTDVPVLCYFTVVWERNFTFKPQYILSQIKTFSLEIFQNRTEICIPLSLKRGNFLVLFIKSVNCEENKTSSLLDFSTEMRGKQI